jgi:hypothetical protein
MSAETTEKPDYTLAAEEAETLWASLGIESEISAPIPDVHDDWPCIHFDLEINGQHFDYNLGVGHARNLRKARDLQCGFSSHEWAVLDLMVKGQTTIDKQAMARVAVKCFDKRDTPKVSMILAACAQDSSAHAQCFEDWATEYGYDVDSRKAESIYRVCVESWHKLRKVGLTPAQIEQFASLAARF